MPCYKTRASSSKMETRQQEMRPAVGQPRSEPSLPKAATNDRLHQSFRRPRGHRGLLWNLVVQSGTLRSLPLTFIYAVLLYLQFNARISVSLFHTQAQ